MTRVQCPDCRSMERFILRGQDGLFRGPNGQRVPRAEAKQFGVGGAHWIRTPDEEIIGRDEP